MVIDEAAGSSLDSGSGTTDSGTSSSPDSNLPPSTITGNESLNPAWAPVLDGVPEMFRNKMTPHLREWDQNYSKIQNDYKSLQEQYEPFKPYAGTDPEVIQYAMNVLQALNTNPKDVYDRLAEHLQQQGLLQVQGKPNEDDEETDPWKTEFEQRQAQLDQRQQQFDAWVEQQSYNSQVSSYEAEVDSQVRALVEKFGPAVDVPDLLQRMKLQVDANGNFSAEQAFEEQKATFQRLYQAQSKQRPAPQIIPTTGTPAPSGDKSPADMNETERKAYFKHLLDLANSGG